MKQALDDILDCLKTENMEKDRTFTWELVQLLLQNHKEITLERLNYVNDGLYVRLKFDFDPNNDYEFTIKTIENPKEKR